MTGSTSLSHASHFRRCSHGRRAPSMIRAWLVYATILAVWLGCLSPSWVRLGLTRLYREPLSASYPRAASQHASVMLRAEGEGSTGSSDANALRVGLLHLPGKGKAFQEAFDVRNVTNETFFQTEVPSAVQMPLAAKLLAMSNTVDVIVIAHGSPAEYPTPLLQGYQTVALTTNVPVVPCEGDGDIEETADTAIAMAEIRQQALMGKGPRRSMFFGIGSNDTNAPGKKEKVYF